MAGTPSGTPTGYTGATALVYDSTKDILWGYSSNSSAWQPLSCDYVGSQITSNRTLSSGGGSVGTGNQFYTIGSLTTNITVTIPKANAVAGQRITLKWAVESTAHTVTIQPATSGGNVEGASTYAFNGSSTEYPAVQIESDGSNWWITFTH
jgi:hypothetical protein